MKQEKIKNLPYWIFGLLFLILIGISNCKPPRPDESPLSLSIVKTPAPVGSIVPIQNLDTTPIVRETLPPLNLEAGYGGVQGIIVSYPTDWNGNNLFVYFAPFYPAPDSDGGGFYMLEPSVHPFTSVTSGGVFQAGNIPPGQYVIVIGPTPQESIPILDGNRPRIFTIKENTITRIGEVSVKK